MSDVVILLDYSASKAIVDLRKQLLNGDGLDIPVFVVVEHGVGCLVDGGVAGFPDLLHNANCLTLSFNLHLSP